mgnify:FL=1
MLNISFITNARTPYRKIQFEEFSKIPNCRFSIYYTNPNVLERKWKVDQIKNVKEVALKGIKISKKYGFVNFGLKKIVLDSDLIMLGGYEQPSYQIVARLCKKYQKKYVLVSDGISPKKINEINKNSLKYKLKNYVVKNSAAIFGNGLASKRYYTKVFDYSEDKIYNQFLTVDVEKIKELGKNKEEFRNYYRLKYNIPIDSEVVIFSGRLIKQKNVDLIMDSLIGFKKVFLLIIGDGEEKKRLSDLARQKGIDFAITGFIEEQEELFKMYYAGDILILPSYDEPWGLVVNEAMAAGLPVIVSNECGCSLDLVRDGENGYILTDLRNSETLRTLVMKALKNKENFSKKSLEIIDNWTFENSRKSFEELLKLLNNSK